MSTTSELAHTDAPTATVAAVRDTRVAYAALVGMAICFGGTWVAGKVAVDALPAFTIAATRFALASVLLYAGSRVLRVRLAPVTRRDLPLVFGLGLSAIAVYNVLFLTGLTLAPATDGAIMVPGIAPVATALLAAPLLGERLTRRRVMGLVLAIVGLVLVVNPGGSLGTERFVGDLLFLAGAACWGLYSVLGRVASRRFDPVSATLYGAIAGTLVLLPFALAEGGVGELAAAGVTGWLGVGYLVVFGTIGGFVLLHVGIRRIGASRAAAFALLVPLVGVSSSAVLLGEALSPLTALGGLVILVGLWLVERGTA